MIFFKITEIPDAQMFWKRKIRSSRQTLPYFTKNWKKNEGLDEIMEEITEKEKNTFENIIENRSLISPNLLILQNDCLSWRLKLNVISTYIWVWHSLPDFVSGCIRREWKVKSRRFDWSNSMRLLLLECHQIISWRRCSPSTSSFSSRPMSISRINLHCQFLFFIILESRLCPQGVISTGGECFWFKKIKTEKENKGWVQLFAFGQKEGSDSLFFQSSWKTMKQRGSSLKVIKTMSSLQWLKQTLHRWISESVDTYSIFSSINCLFKEWRNFNLHCWRSSCMLPFFIRVAWFVGSIITVDRDDQTSCLFISIQSIHPQDTLSRFSFFDTEGSCFGSWFPGIFN